MIDIGPTEGRRIRRAGGIGRVRPEIGTKVCRVPRPRRPETVFRDRVLHAYDLSHATGSRG
jgi:hypothetical protein